MALTYKINIYATDPEDSTKTMVTFMVEDNDPVETNATFAITKKITTGSKTREQILTEAQTSCTAEIASWKEEESMINRMWNPDTEQIE